MKMMMEMRMEMKMLKTMKYKMKKMKMEMKMKNVEKMKKMRRSGCPGSLLMPEESPGSPQTCINSHFFYYYYLHNFIAFYKEFFRHIFGLWNFLS